MSLTKKATKLFFLGLGNVVHSYLQFCIKCKVRNTDKQKYISQMSAIDVYDTINHLTFK